MYIFLKRASIKPKLNIIAKNFYINTLLELLLATGRTNIPQSLETETI